MAEQITSLDPSVWSVPPGSDDDAAAFFKSWRLILDEHLAEKQAVLAELRAIRGLLERRFSDQALDGNGAPRVWAIPTCSAPARAFLGAEGAAASTSLGFCSLSEAQQAFGVRPEGGLKPVPGERTKAADSPELPGSASAAPPAGQHRPESES